MELVPRVPSERATTATLAGVAALTAASTTAVALDLVRANVSLPVTFAAACGALVLGLAWARSMPRTSLFFSPIAVPVAVVALATGQRIGPVAAAAAAGGVAAGLLLRPLWRAHTTMRVEGALDRFESLAVVGSRVLLVCSLLGLLFARSGAVHVLAGLAGAGALASLAVVTLRDRTRTATLRRIYGKLDPAFRVELDKDVQGHELLPPMLSGTLTNAVIAHVEPGAATYRTSVGPRPLARCDAALAKMLVRLGKRSRAMAIVGGLALASTALQPFVALRGTVTPKSAMAATPHLDVPACSDARAYFEDQLERSGGLGRAALLTHAQDPTIAPGEGVLLVVPRSGPHEASAQETAHALSIARDIPCKDRLALRVEAPRYRPFSVDATLTLDEGADKTRVLAQANQQVRDLFQTDSRSTLEERFGFGASEKSFGYRVRWALRHVEGVRGVRLEVDGSDADIPLEPRDFPTLASLTLRVHHD